jgi:serine/threonine protein kinase
MLATCYSREQLEGYLCGRLSDDLSEQVESHVADCPTCEDTLSELDGAGDTLIRTLRLKTSAAVEDVPDWIDQVAESQSAENDSVNRAETRGEPPSRLGDYELQGVIGRGGMSIVFSARHAHLGRDVALKVLLPTHQQQGVSRDRFAREMRAVGALDHPAIVRATDAGQYRDTLYLAMEKIDGVDLTLVSRRLGPLSIADACQIAAEAARGLSYAHRQGVVHRDIKPSNLILDEQGRVKILDFGLARIQSAVGEVSLQTTVGQLLGTLDYMAPEQADGRDVDARADIYALGATLFKLLAGTPPHGRSAETPILEHLNRLATEHAPELSDFRDDLPERLVEFISSMLCRDPAERVSNAEEVAERLDEFAAGSDLRALRDQAYDASASRTGDAAESSVRESLNEIWPEVGEYDDASQQKPAIRDGSNATTRRRWPLIAVGLFGLIVTMCLGVVILLQTDRGEIRIESEVDNLQVEILKDGQLSDSLVVKQGATEVQVRSGKYLIRIASPSDGVEVTPKQVVVTRAGTAIATIQRTPNAVETVEASNQASQNQEILNLQIKLAETTSQLATARQQFGPDHPEVKQLTEQVTRLQALSRPIPSEPVYEGRTLSDWLAQMRFEQQAEAKRYAAKSVVELSGTRPGGGGLKLALEAGELLMRMEFDHERDLSLRADEAIYQLVSGYSQPFGKESRHTLDVPLKRAAETDRADAVRMLADLIASDEAMKRSYGLFLVARLHRKIASGEENWDPVLQAVRRLIADPDQRTRVQAGTILAACAKDKAEAVAYLTEADSRVASHLTLISWFVVSRDRKLSIPRDRHIEWLAEYFVKIPDADELQSLLIEPTLGPLVGVNWSDVEDDEIEVVSRALGRLLDKMRRESEQLADEPRLESSVSAKSNVLCTIIDHVAPDEPTREVATKVLHLRLQHLLELRARSDSSLQPLPADSPSRLAVAITLLTGTSPPEIRQAARSVGSFAPELESLSELSDPRAFMAKVQNRFRGFEQVCAWCPYEVLRQFTIIEARRSSSPSSRGRSSNLLSLLSRSPTVHPVLIADFAANSVGSEDEVEQEAFAVFNRLTKAQDFASYLQRHPNFLKRMTDWATQFESGLAIDTVVDMFEKAWPEEEFLAFLFEWLHQDEPIHKSYAIARLRSHDRVRLRGEWGRDAARAIAEMAAARESFQAVEIYYLDELKEAAEPAVEQLAKFITSQLESPEELLAQTTVTLPSAPPLHPRTHSFRPMLFALEILKRFAPQVTEMRPAIEAALSKQTKRTEENVINTVAYRSALQRLLQAME